ncbi:MAG: aminopeptidase P family protein [Rhodothermales bacterium]
MIHPEVAALDRRFTADTYRARRDHLRDTLGGGLVLLPGTATVWRNADNPHPFRQSSHVLYYAGIARPGLFLLLDADAGTDTLFGPPDDFDDLVWHGPHPSREDLAAEAGIADVRDVDELKAVLAEAKRQGRTVHYPPAFMPGTLVALARLLGESVDAVEAGASEALMRAVGEQRAVKSDAEIAEIEAAVAVSAEMYAVAMRMTRPGLREVDVRAAMVHVALQRGLEMSFEPITSVRGEVLHNHASGNTLRDGQLFLLDSGVETPEGYASDITRTIPVSGRFSDEQRAIYEIVLRAEEDAIAAVRPGVNFRDLHLAAARTIADGLKGVGLMRGDVDDAVEAGAHALFFPHGLGHPIGLDTHDVQDLGDTYAYPADRPRSDQFGLGFLRFARDLAPGHVMTIEPGCYFIPPLIDRWRSEGRHTAFIDYDAVDRFRDFGGIRIEDDVLCTDDGPRVLGPGIPKSVGDVETAMAEPG